MRKTKPYKQINLGTIYTESLAINWVITSQYNILLCRHIDVILGSMMQAKINDISL